MAEPNGNGNGNSNGRNGVSWASGLINIATSGVLLAVFIAWWGVANPGPRIDKLEAADIELRKELISGYLSLREHQEFQARNNHIIAAIEKRLEDFRGYYLDHEQKFAKLPDLFVPRAECLLRAQKDEKLFDITQARIDRLYGIMDDLSKRISSTRETIFTKDQSRLSPK